MDIDIEKNKKTENDIRNLSFNDRFFMIFDLELGFKCNFMYQSKKESNGTVFYKFCSQQEKDKFFILCFLKTKDIPSLVAPKKRMLKQLKAFCINLFLKNDYIGDLYNDSIYLPYGKVFFVKSNGQLEELRDIDEIIRRMIASVSVTAEPGISGNK